MQANSFLGEFVPTKIQVQKEKENLCVGKKAKLGIITS